MLATEVRTTIQKSARPVSRSSSVVKEERILASDLKAREATNEAWDSIVDNKLIEWGMDQEVFRLEGLVGPTRVAIANASNVVEFMREFDLGVPTGVIADGDGGLAFEYRNDPFYQRINIDENGKVEIVDYEECRIVRRSQLEFE